MVRGGMVICSGFCLGVCAFAQDPVNNSSSPPATPSAATPPAASASAATPSQSPVLRNWQNFVSETFVPLTLAAGAFYGALSQATNSDPRYGVGTGALGQRIGASTADIVTQNFFGDFVMASAFHENTLYVRRGSGYGGTWKRAGYAISRALITGSDRGGDTFNWSNVTGTAMSAGFSNLYYPPASRTGGAMAIHFGTSLAGCGFANLFPEFWPDFKAMLQRHHLFPPRW
jgi:hypothetical protein